MDQKYQTDLLENVFTAHVLVMADTIKRQKKEKGVTSTSDFIDDAIRLISREKPRILRTLRATP